MFEYKVRRVKGDGTGDIERICNEHEEDDWRLISKSAEDMGVLRVRVWLFFQREVPDERGSQDTWRAQHG